MHLTKECVALSDEVTLSRRAHGTGRRNPNSLQTRSSVSVPAVSRVSACMLSHTLCDPMDCSPPGSSGHGISQARILVWGCHFLLQGIFPTQGLNLHLCVSGIAGRLFTAEPLGKP